MSAEGMLHAALLTALRGDAVLGAGLNAVFAGPAASASPPYAEIGELIGVDWGTKTAAGRELHAWVTLRDVGETPARVQRLAGAAGDAIAALPRELAGWRVASVAAVRTRMPRGSPGSWTVTIEYRVRMMEVVE